MKKVPRGAFFILATAGQLFQPVGGEHGPFTHLYHGAT
jgi:hypothetical protein